MANTILLKESKSGSDEIAYVKGQDNTVVGLNAALKPESNILDIFSSVIKKILLPQGYPESVSGDYMRYQLWDTLQAFCSTITNTLATKAVLQGVGVGDNTASSLGAAITWIMKDGCGMMSSIVFAWISGTRLDGECKKWRLFADVLNDIAICIEIIILPHFKSDALKILCFSTSLKAVVGVAGGATRAAITQHQAIKNNMADVSAKDGSQETCVNLVASFLGLAILSVIGDSGTYIWTLFFGATILHLFSNFKAVKALNINKFNTERLNYVIQDYILTERICTPAETNRRESVILGSGLNSKYICGYNIKIGDSIEQLVKKKQIYPFELQLLTHVYKGRKYLLLTNMINKVIYICLDRSYTSSDILEGYFHGVFHAISASYLAKHDLDVLKPMLLENKNSLPYKIIKAAETGKNEGKILSRLDADVVIAIDNLASQESSIFLSALSKYGWSLENNHLYIGDWRASWKEALVTGKK
ncbi:RUS family member 1 [Halyomorpha halys]|uniref:RUS family member 1 n=1 Tax=Halyomorpha halys TaxID=286706 RepID=UPI0006D50CF0|nr:RUS1 family protein C16orf58 homolog [Halyomorpha halys]